MRTSYRLDAAAERCLVVGLLCLSLDGRLRKTRAAASHGGIMMVLGVLRASALYM
jgi:hypothetical protein